MVSDNENTAEVSDPARLNLLGLSRAELEKCLVEELEEKPFRAKQLTQWVFEKRVSSFEEMSNISKPSRELMQSKFCFTRPEIVTWQESKDGTIKFLVQLADGSEVESVLICQPRRYTLCISSQVGCAIGCSFCRTALMGLARHLETSEIIGQAMAVLDFIDSPPKEVKKKPEPFKNVVFMGMGEPMHNADNVFRAARILTDEYGLQLSYKRVTISTSGLIPKIDKFTAEEVPASLAISLNATTNESRDKLIPINKKWPIEDLLRSVKAYTSKSGREVTMEYVMLSGVNDSAQDLARLAKLLHGFPMKLNLIPYNDNSGLGYYSPSKEHIIGWQKKLVAKGFNTRVRWSKGEDIDAACGQLAVKNAA